MDKTSEPGPEKIVSEEAVTIRRSPRYFRFMVAGACVGLIVALVLTVLFPEPAGFSFGQVFGFLAIVWIAVGVGGGSIVALLLDRVRSKRTRTVQVSHLQAREMSGEAER